VNNYGLDAEFLYKFLRGSKVKTGKRVGIGMRSAVSDKALMKDCYVVTVTDTEGNHVGWSNGYALFTEPTPVERPAKHKEEDRTYKTDDFAPLLNGEGTEVWPVRITQGLGETFVEFAPMGAPLTAKTTWINGKFLSAMLKRASANVTYKLVPSLVDTPILGCFADGKAVCGVMPCCVDIKRVLKNAEVVVKVSRQYYPYP